MGLVLLRAGVGFTQDYCWPTDASRLMTSSFGEYRPGHFHAGMDIKTWNEVGYRVFAIDSGSIVRLRVSPYGYGRAIYLRLDNGMTAVYAHLSRFSNSFEGLVREEQRRVGRFLVEKTFQLGRLRVEKAETIAYTGRTGTGVPHLHFEVRDSLNRPFNPLFLLDDAVEDKIPPTLKSVAVSPLSYGSHVDGDFQPRVFPVHREGAGVYRLDDVVKVWGRVGLSVSCFDRADGATNRLAVHQIRFFVDGQPVFSTRYDRFSYDDAGQVELDRDYRLNRWGWGMFQKLYRDVGNVLPFYEPEATEAGILFCWNEADEGNGSRESLPLYSERKTGPVFLTMGDHLFRIEVLDYFGNLSVVHGVLRMVPLSAFLTAGEVSENEWEEILSRGEENPTVVVEKQFLDDRVRFCVRSDELLPEMPRLMVAMNIWDQTAVSLIPRSRREFVGVYPLKRGIDGLMTTELRVLHPTEGERVVRDTVQVFAVTPEEGGAAVSPDGAFRVVFPRGAVYRPVWTRISQDTVSHGMGEVLSWRYDILPQDVPLRGRANVQIRVATNPDDAGKIGVYTLGRDGKAAFVGNAWDGGMVFAQIGGLNGFAVLKDTTAPVISFVQPPDGITIRDRTPRVVVGFRDELSGIFGEENYIVVLDGRPLIVEYDPEEDRGFCEVDEMLHPGEHVIDVTIRDRADNITQRRSLFYIQP